MYTNIIYYTYSECVFDLTWVYLRYNPFQVACVQVKKMGILTANMQKQLQQKKGTEMEQKVNFLEMITPMLPRRLLIAF